MPIWIEIRCSVFNLQGLRCWSADNNGPMQASGEGKMSIRSTLVNLNTEAKRTGWRRTRDGWVCPACVKVFLDAPPVVFTLTAFLPADDPPPHYFTPRQVDAYLFAQQAGCVDAEVKLKGREVWVRSFGGKPRYRLGCVK